MCQSNEKRSCIGKILAIVAAIAAVAGAAVLVCRILSKRSGGGSCPCKRLVSRFFPKPDPDAADFAD